jgi:hypothetical protein
MKYELRRFGVLETARVLGILYAILGLLLAPLFALGSIAAPREGGFGLVFALLLPAVYGILGFVMTIIAAALYNWIAGWVGGIAFEIAAPDDNVTGPSLLNDR